MATIRKIERRNRYTCRVSFNSKKDFLYFKSYLDACGGTIDEEISVPKTNGTKKKTELEKAMEDIKNGNTIKYGSFEEFKGKIEKQFNLKKETAYS